MSRPSVATFVENFFTNMLFQEDEMRASVAVMEDVAEDATILINGDVFDRRRLAEGNILPFRVNFTGKLTEFKDLNIRSLDNITGHAAQHADFIVTPKASVAAAPADAPHCGNAAKAGAAGRHEHDHAKCPTESVNYGATTLVTVGLKPCGSQVIQSLHVIMGPHGECGVEQHAAPAEAKAKAVTA